jgi:hypothetical protein
MRVKVNKK